MYLVQLYDISCMPMHVSCLAGYVDTYTMHIELYVLYEEMNEKIELVFALLIW